MHAELLAHQVPGASVAAVADVDPAAAREAASRLGVRARTADEVLSDPGIAAVAICSSYRHPRRPPGRGGEAGKAVFCEKPMSLDLAEVDRALAAIDAAAVPLQIGFNRRFDPAHASVREAVAAGAVGEPHLVRISSRDPELRPARLRQDARAGCSST